VKEITQGKVSEGNGFWKKPGHVKIAIPHPRQWRDTAIAAVPFRLEPSNLPSGAYLTTKRSCAEGRMGEEWPGSDREYYSK